MYRELEIPRREERAPTEFVYAPRSRSATQRSMIQLLLAPAVFVGVLVVCMAGLGWPPAASALLGAVATAGTLALVARGMSARQVTRLRVDGHELEVWAPSASGAARAPVRMPLLDLRDVALDTEAIERVIDGPSAIPAMRFADARVAPPIDVARIVLSFRDGSLVPLSAERLSHLETADVYGKMRVFLRKNGWRPDDERE
jgi:hypothetical protein